MTGSAKSCPVRRVWLSFIPSPHSLRRGLQGFGSSEWQNNEEGRVGGRKREMIEVLGQG